MTTALIKAEVKEQKKSVFFYYFQNDPGNSVSFYYKNGHHNAQQFTLNGIFWNARKASKF